MDGWLDRAENDSHNALIRWRHAAPHQAVSSPSGTLAGYLDWRVLALSGRSLRLLHDAQPEVANADKPTEKNCYTYPICDIRSMVETCQFQTSAITSLDLCQRQSLVILVRVRKHRSLQQQIGGIMVSRSGDIFRAANLIFSGGLHLTLALAVMSDANALSPGTVFSDCDGCPQMVVVPAGSFEMGESSDVGLENERPVHEVIIPEPLAVGVTEVTYAQWDLCVSEGGCSHVPIDDNWGRGNRAVADVNWADVSEYLDWISRKTGNTYRLPTEAEWEYFARAGTTTLHPWGNEFVSGKAVCLSCEVGFVMTIEVGRLEPNGFGLYDTVGSQREWVQDCWNASYDDAPADGTAWVTGDCSRRVVRGGSWYDSARFIRSASRAGAVVVERIDVIGFRLVRNLEP